MLKYLKNSSFKVSADLNPFMWGFVFDACAYPMYLYWRFLFLAVFVIIDDGLDGSERSESSKLPEHEWDDVEVVEMK